MSVMETRTRPKTQTMMLAEKCRNAEVEISEKHGGFTLFALVQRESTAGKWDIVVSAPWLTRRMADMKIILDGLMPFLSQEDWLRTAGIVPVDLNTDFVQTLVELYHVEHGTQLAGQIFTDEIIVDRAVIITANLNAF